MSSFEVSTIKEALQLPLDTSVSVAGKVFEKGEDVEYTTREKAVRKYVPIAIADGEDLVRIRLYNVKSTVTVQTGRTYLFMNALRKVAVEELWAVSTTQIMAWANIEVPVEVYAKLQEDTTNNNAIVPFEKALISTAACTIQAKVVQTSPVKYVRDGQLEMKLLGLKDLPNGKTVKLALFGQDATHTYSEGDVVFVSDTYRWKETGTLSTKKTSKVEFLAAETLHFNITNEDYLDDEEFSSQPVQSAEPEAFTIMGLAGAFVYQCCSNPSCKNKKLADGKCPVCNRLPLTHKAFYSSAIVVIEHHEQLVKRTIFKPEMEQLFNLPPLSSTTSAELTTAIIGQLPVNGQAIFTNNSMKIVTSKRKHSNE